MADIFEEVDEDLRRDTAAALWAKYQNLVYGAVALIVIGTAAATGWQIYDRNAREKAGLDYLSALQRTTQDPKAAPELLGQLIHAGGPFASLARFDLVHAALKAGDKAKALELLTTMAGDAEFAAPLKGAAALMGGYVALDLGKADAALALVQPLSAEGQPYRLAAIEITGLAAYATGDTAKAKEIYQGLDTALKKDEAQGLGTAPANLRDRVAIMLDRLGA
ncbi:tetratricopeptide repeat protein [Dongia sp.]|uniref:tetratricopeptide repeat protein n=1 Tax=Dongia sp. TaxID=1977262 RepID=UPI0035AEE7D5